MALTVTQSYDFIRLYDKQNGSTRAQSVYLKIINDTCREIYGGAGCPDFTVRSTRVSLAAPYSTGTVSIVAGDTTVTGSGTTFTSAMVGRHIRFNGEAEQYRITAYTGATSISVENYLGPANLSGVTYTITDERKAMPTNCRSIHQIVTANASGSRGSLYYLQPKPFEYLNLMRQTYQTSDYPYYFATKWEPPTSGNVPVGYYYLYPATSTAQIVTVFYNIWPTEVSSGSDQLPIPYEWEHVAREYFLAFLYRENKDQNWQAQWSKAQAAAAAAMAATRSNTAHRQRVEWTPPTKLDNYREPVIDPDVLAQLDP
jgi:hypothetical protein